MCSCGVVIVAPAGQTSAARWFSPLMKRPKALGAKTAGPMGPPAPVLKRCAANRQEGMKSGIHGPGVLSDAVVQTDSTKKPGRPWWPPGLRGS